MLNELRDLVKYTSNLGIGVIKLTGDKDGITQIEGVDNDKSLVIKGKFLSSLPELEGTSGLSNLDWLSGFVNIYREKNDTIEVIRNDRTTLVEVRDDDDNPVLDINGVVKQEKVTQNVLEEIKFVRPTPRMVNVYRVVDQRMIPEQYNFRGSEWDVIIEPTKQSIDLLSLQASVGYEQFFGVKTENNVLYFTFGETGSQAELEFATNVSGELTKAWVWDITQVLSILKLSEKAECTMSFLDMGALQITLETGLAVYNYILPAKAR